MKLYYPITVDLYKPYPLPLVEAQQNNIGRGVLVTLTAQGAVITPTGESIQLYAKKPDGTISYLACTLSGSQIECDFTNQMLSLPGMVQVELQMIGGTSGNETEITTPIFCVKVNPSNVDDSAVESQDEFTALVTALAEVAELKKNGLKGDPGEAATIQVGTVTASDPGSNPQVLNSGSAQAAVLNFVLPRGEPGSIWYYGTAITGTATSGTVFPGSGITNAKSYDKYVNTADGNIYNCAVGGAPDVAQWAYIGNIMGPAGATQIVFAAYSDFPESGDTEKLYVDTATTDALSIWRWNGTEYVTVDTSDIAVIADPYNPDNTYAARAYCTHEGGFYKSNQAIDVAEAWTPSHWTQTTVAAELSALNSRGALTALYTSSKAITNTAAQITISHNVSDFRKLIFFFGYTHTVNAATPIEIPVELFNAGYTATYSFAGASSKTCWGQAAYINDNTISLVGSDGDGYDPYLLAVYGES